MKGHALPGVKQSKTSPFRFGGGFPGSSSGGAFGFGAISPSLMVGLNVKGIEKIEQENQEEITTEAHSGEQEQGELGNIVASNPYKKGIWNILKKDPSHFFRNFSMMPSDKERALEKARGNLGINAGQGPSEDHTHNIT